MLFVYVCLVYCVCVDFSFTVTQLGNKNDDKKITSSFGILKKKGTSVKASVIYLLRISTTCFINVLQREHFTKSSLMQ